MNRKISITLMSLIFVLTLLGCNSNSSTNDIHNHDSAANTGDAEEPYLTFTDDIGKKVVLPSKPKRIVILNESLELFYQLGGQVVGRATAPDVTVPEGAKTAVDVGQINQVSLEKITSLEPDLVIGHPFFHTHLIDALAVGNIPLAFLKIESYDDFINKGKLLGSIIGNVTETEKALRETDERIQRVVQKVPDRSPTFAILTIMPMGISIVTSDSLALDIAERLKMKNAAMIKPSGNIPGSVPYSVEKLIETDPDYLFISVHGTEQFGQKKLKSDLESNPAWASLRAVKDGRMAFLTSDFVNPAGLNVDRTFQHMAKLVYPEIYGN
ncbi:ABC transporter substrate-binding protein [Paenibacillus sp. GCM10012303]|uniref:ABC transporter substrate-binding protein n=1 Tax=Paenibacillus sp. GCM10012303 TaxID=3317340 RepID=UPI00361B7882